MSTAKVAISIDRKLLEQIDLLVQEKKYSNRSQAIQEALKEKMRRWQQKRLASECAKLSAKEERALSEEGLTAGDDVCPEY
ncbi:MAG: ribbon-helix-helix domain-containing protein [Proteobacteria bacterium]|nr:ribbon-helix-helix domain-containing protein [Pseudomonadota bacterium]